MKDNIHQEKYVPAGSVKRCRTYSQENNKKILLFSTILPIYIIRTIDTRIENGMLASVTFLYFILDKLEIKPGDEQDDS